VQLNALFCCLWRNVEASYHKHFVVFSGNQHRRLLPAITCETVAVVHRRPRLQVHLPVAALTQAVKPDIGSESLIRFLPTNYPIVKNSQKQSKKVRRQPKQQKWPLVYQSSHVYQDCTNSVLTVYQSSKTVKNNFCLLHLHSTSPLGEFPSEYCYAVWYRKTRMAWLPDGKKIWWYVYSFWHDPQTWQTHRQTNRRTNRHRMTT